MGMDVYDQLYDEYEKQFKIRWEIDGKWTNSSRDRSGKSTTIYPNKDKYEGEYKDGVSYFSFEGLGREMHNSLSV